MRTVTLLLASCVTLAVAGQLPQRTAAQTPTVSGAPGTVTAAPTASGAPARDPLTAVIRGRVIRADDGQPIEGAHVTTTNAGLGVAVTDEEGRFELTHLRAGTYGLTAHTSGSPGIGYGSRRLGDPGHRITLTPGQVVNGVDFAIPRGAVIAGILLDERGEPAARAPVWVLRHQYVNGQRRLTSVIADSTPGMEARGDLTDDLGRFRIFGLRAGTYYLGAAPPDISIVGAESFLSYDLSAPTLYPIGGSIADARPLTVTAGQELSGLTFGLRPVKTANITVVMSSKGGPYAGEFSYEQVGGPSALSVRAGPDGRYTLSRRPPGKYRFFARDGDQVVFAQVELNGDDLVVPLTPKRGGTARGRIVIEGEAPAGLQHADINVTARLLEPAKDARATITPDLSFEVTGLLGPVHLTGSTRTGWSMKSLLVNGIDMTGLPLDGSRVIDDIQLVLTRQVVELSGIVRDATGRAAADAFVVLFAEDAERRWPGNPYIRSIRADGEGRFTLRNALPGRYRAVAVEFLESGEESDPDVVRQLEAASTSVTLSQGATPTLDLRLVPWP